MPEPGKTTIQFKSKRNTLEKLWVSELLFEAAGVWCVERSKPEYEIFIPYSSIIIITRPRKGRNE